MNKRDDDKLTSFLAVVIVFGVLILLVSIFNGVEEKKCSRYGCDRTVSGSGSYCYIHDTYRSSSSYKSSYSSSSGSSSQSSSGTSTSGSSASGSTKKSTSGSSSKKSSSSSKRPSYSSYDEGYDAVYEDDDYDWDRYWSDSDYADGVEDAMDDLGW